MLNMIECRRKSRSSTSASKSLKFSTHDYSVVFQVEWAIPRVIQTAYIETWNMKEGAGYIPWAKLPDDISRLYGEGSVLDTTSLPPDAAKSKIAEQNICNLS